jgi:general secretion pathway protein G
MRSWGLVTAGGQALNEQGEALGGNNRMAGLNPKSKIQNPKFLNPAFTLIELIATMAIMLLLTTIALPLARVHAQRLRELELRRDLRELRQAIDRYKDMSDRSMIPPKSDGFGYPPDLDTLVKGVELKGSASAKYKFLRRIPVDPMTGKPNWGMRSIQDDPDSRSWGGQNVFDVYSQSQGRAMDGSAYADW